MKTTKLLISSLVLLTALSTSMFGTVLVVPGTSNIFGSGFGSVPGGQGGTLPPVVGGFSTSVFGEAVVVINSVTGSVSCGVGCPASSGAEGFAVSQPANGATNISAPGNGISGIQFTGRDFFLVGVFLGSSAPSVAPSTLVYSIDGVTNAADGVPTFQPALSQVFYIGDGRTGFNNGAGTQQKFFAPIGATRLFLGFADATAFQGAPGMYSDNSSCSSEGGPGCLNVDLTVITPEPGTIMLMGLGLFGFALLRKKIA